MMTPRIVALLLFACLCAGSCGCGGSHDYAVEEYRAAFAVPATGDHADVTLDILYDIGSTPKAEGFKFVGTGPVTNLVAHDDRGAVVRCETRQMRETRISWHFDPVANARKRIIVSFRLPGALQRDGSTLTLDAPWAGVFRVPVRHARYEIIFPPRTSPRILSSTPGGGIESLQGALVFIARQSPLSEKRFAVSFDSGGPHVTRPEIQPKRAIPATPRTERSSDTYASILREHIPVVVVSMVIFFILFNFFRVMTRKGGTGSSGGCSSSSCSGGGCGGGCGGECGGGCGG